MQDLWGSDRLAQPGPRAHAWELLGACRQADPDLFFNESERRGTRRCLEAQAKAVCAQCPVITQCREHAIAVQEPWGIWGGLTLEDRQAEQRSRRSARTWPDTARSA